MSWPGYSVWRGNTLASAAFRTPRISLKLFAAARTAAPVLPAVTIASASPAATMRAATLTEASFFARSASRGSSAMPIAAEQWRTAISSGL